MKKLLAILCTVALLLTSLFTGMAVAAEDTATELTQLAPSNYGANGQSFATGEAWGGAPGVAPSALVNARFDAMVIPTATSHMIQLGWWSGVRYTISGTTAKLTLFDTADYAEATVDSSYYNTPYKLTITANQYNVGVLPEEDGEYTTDHEHIVYNVYINDEIVIKDFVMLANHSVYTTATTQKSLRGNKCIIYNVDTFDSTFTATDADAASDLDKLTTLTPADFNMPYGAHYSAAYTQASKETANTVFETNVMFEYGGQLVYPRAIGWPGIKLAASGTKLVLSDFSLGSGWATSGTTIATIEPATVNEGSLVGNMLNLKVSLEVGNFGGANIENDDGSITVLENDVRLTYYINDIKVWGNVHLAQYNEYDENDNPIPESQIAKTGKLLFTEASGNLFNMVHAERVVLEDPNVEVPVMLENAATSGGLVVGKLNTVDVTLAEGDSIAMGYYGNLAVTEGALVYTDKAGTATTVATNMAGVKFNLKTLAERIDLDGNGYATEVKARVWINNKATSAYQYLVGTLPVDQAITLSGTAALSAASQVPTDLREYSLAAFNKPDVNVSNVTGWSWMVAPAEIPGSSIDTIFSTNICIVDRNVASTDGRAQFLLNYGGIGLNLSYGASDLRGMLTYPNGNLADWLSAGVPNIGTEFLFQIAIQRASKDLNNDGVNNDVRVAFFIDGNLFTNKYYVIDASALTGAVSVSSQYSTGAATTMSYTVKNATPSTNLSEYTEIGIEDVGFENGTYKTSVDSDKTAYGDGAQVAKTINNTVLKTKVKWVRAEGATGALDMVLTYAGGASWGNSINFGMGADDIGTVTIANSYTYKLPDLTEGEEHELMVSTKMVDGGWKYGVYVDGNLQNNTYYYWANKGDDWRTVLMGIRSLYGNAASELTVGGDNFTVGETVDSSYTVAADTDTKTYTVNGDAVGDTARVLDTVGEYEITCTSKMIYGTTGIVDQTGTKTVVIYKENDLNADNEVNILDFIAAQKSAADTDGTYDLGKVGAYAAGIAVGEKCTAKEIVAIKIALLFAL